MKRASRTAGNYARKSQDYSRHAAPAFFQSHTYGMPHPTSVSASSPSYPAQYAFPPPPAAPQPSAQLPQFFEPTVSMAMPNFPQPYPPQQQQNPGFYHPQMSALDIESFVLDHKNLGKSKFLVSIRNGLFRFGRLTDKQLAAVHSLIEQRRAMGWQNTHLRSLKVDPVITRLLMTSDKDWKKIIESVSTREEDGEKQRMYATRASKMSKSFRMQLLKRGFLTSKQLRIAGRYYVVYLDQYWKREEERPERRVAMATDELDGDAEDGEEYEDVEDEDEESDDRSEDDDDIDGRGRL